MHAIVAGQGLPVILIHGYSPANSWRVWQYNIAALCARHKVFALDLPGYGDSSPTERPLSVKEQAANVVAFMDKARLRRAALVGVSFGGAVAQHVAVEHPERVWALVLVDSGFDDSPAGRARLRKIHCPTLVIWGQEDNVVPVEWATVLAKAIPGAGLVLVPNAGHWPHHAQPDIFNQHVTRFLTQNAILLKKGVRG